MTKKKKNIKKKTQEKEEIPKKTIIKTMNLKEIETQLFKIIAYFYILY